MCSTTERQLGSLNGSDSHRMNYYVKLPIGIRIGPFLTVGAAQHWCLVRDYGEYSIHMLQSPLGPPEQWIKQGPDH